MRTSRVVWCAVAVLAGLTGCSSGGSDVADPKPKAAKPTTAKGELPPLAERYLEFDPTDFDATSADIDNPYFPQTPGSRLVFDGSDKRGSGRSSHRVEVVVTDLTRVIDGVETAVIWESDFVNDALEETELIYLAQDTAGNVWHLGQYSELYEDGELLGAGGFLKGYLAGARAGIFMPADPRTGTPSYSQGLGPPPINWTDRAKVIATGRTVKVPAGEYKDVIVIEEYTESERTAFQLKYFAPGVGNIKVGWRGDDTSQETLVLTASETVDAAGLDRARAAADDLEARSRIWGTPAPATRRPAPAS